MGVEVTEELLREIWVRASEATRRIYTEVDRSAPESIEQLRLQAEHRKLSQEGYAEVFEQYGIKDMAQAYRLQASEWEQVLKSLDMDGKQAFNFYLNRIDEALGQARMNKRGVEQFAQLTYQAQVLAQRYYPSKTVEGMAKSVEGWLGQAWIDVSSAALVAEHFRMQHDPKLAARYNRSSVISLMQINFGVVPPNAQSYLKRQSK